MTADDAAMPPNRSPTQSHPPLRVISPCTPLALPHFLATLGLPALGFLAAFKGTVDLTTFFMGVFLGAGACCLGALAAACFLGSLAAACLVGACFRVAASLGGA